MMKKIVIVALAVFALDSCFVKEDRTMCPCRLMLDFSNVDTSVVRELSVLVSDGNAVVLNEHLSVEDFGTEYIRDVPHGALRVNVWSGDDADVVGKGITIPYGCECPPVYMYSFVADTRGEVCREVVDMHKNHCRLTVLVEGMETMPYSLTFKGNVDGYGLDGQPSCGDFSCVAYPGLSGDSQALLPRQMDSSLILEVDDGMAVTKMFAIGEYILSSGYDWTADDLEDLTVTLDYYVTYIKISVQGWQNEYCYSIVL